MNQMRCPKCGIDWDSTSKFCLMDGTQLVRVEIPKCQCGETMMPSAKFCAQCGRPRAEALQPGKPTNPLASAGLKI